MHPFLFVRAARERGSCSPFSGRPFARLAPSPVFSHRKARTPTEPFRAANPKTLACGLLYGATHSPAGSSSTEILHFSSSYALRQVSMLK
jgi:hypothetical protein